MTKPSWDHGFASGSGDAAEALLWDGLAGNWHHRLGRTGGEVFDVSGHGTDVTNNGATWQVGDNGDQLLFNGTSDHMISSTVNSATVTGGQISIVANVGLPSTGLHDVVAKCAGGGFINYMLRLWDRRVSFVYNGTSGAIHIWWTDVANVMTQAGSVAFTFTFGDGSSPRAYIDGVLQSGVWRNGDGTEQPKAGTDPLYIGSSFDGSGNPQIFWDSTIDSVSLWQRTIDDSEVTLLANDADAIVRLAERRVGVSAPFVPYPYPLLPSMTGGMLV
jgi:hypothetical protein